MSEKSQKKSLRDGDVIEEIKTVPQKANVREHKFDRRWFFATLLVVVALIAAIIVNLNHAVNDATKVTGTMDVDNGDLKINWDRYQTVDIELSETLTLNESGTYHLTGSLEDGSINIKAGTGEVRLILDNVVIKNSSGPAIYCLSAEDLVIELVGENTLEDGSSYSSDYDEDVTGTIYSKADLSFRGDGTLNLIANYQDGIIGKDDLKFNDGTYKITAVDDAIRGKDSVYIVSGDYILESGADAIKSTNETTSGKGFILIENGNFNFTASAKGIKSVNSILIYSGNFVLNTYDDAIHSNNYVGIIGGIFNITSGDDGVHANRELIIDGGNINIAKAYEGLEAQVITINNGNISLTTSDDGINAGGGNDSSANNRPGAGAFDADENCILSINGGEVYINSSGDGVDSNGWLYFNGGKVIIDGPTDNGNGALDSDTGIVMNGGEVIAIGSSGMAGTLGSSSSVYNVSIYLTSVQTAKTLIEIKDSNDETIISHTSAKTFNHISAGSSKFEFGKTYTIYLNGEKYQTFTISNITTTVGNNNNFNNNFRR